MGEGVLARYLMTLVDVMKRDYAVAPDLLYDAAGLPALPMGAANERVSTDYADKLWGAASKLADTELGLKLGAAVRYTSYASLGHLLMTSETVGDAIRTAAENAHYIGAGHFDLEENAEELTLTYILDVRHPVRELRAVASIVPYFTLAHTVAEGVLPSRVWLQVLEGKHQAVYEKYLGKDIEFGARTSGVSWQRSVLDLPMRDANPALNELLHQHLRQELRQRTSVTARIEAILDDVLSQPSPEVGAFSLDYCSRILGVPRRSLQRSLKQEEQSFRDLLNAKRMERASKLLSETEMSVSEIAHALGYSEAAAFVRAFKSIQNLSPSAYRADCQS